MTPFRWSRGTGSGTGAGDLPGGKKSQANQDLRNTNRALLPALFFALLVVAVHFGFQREMPTALLWAMAYLLGGATLGFLFGIPKVLQGNLPASGQPKNGPPPQGDGTATAATQTSSKSSDSADAYRQQVNTNLTEISDWLTKIIVGLGLINLAKIPPHVSRLADTMATGLNTTSAPNEKSFALGIIICFSFLGFLFGYLYTRLFLAAAFSRADTIAMEIEQQIDAETARATNVSGREPTKEQLQAAEKVAKLASQGDSSYVRNELVALAREYERLRAVMPWSAERTQKLDQLVARMRTLALACYSFLPEFAQSKMLGDRLAAIAMLQVQANPGYIEWLADRIAQEKPFIAYHAAQALLTAVRSLGSSYYPALQAAIERARESIKDKPYVEDVDAILATAKKELEASMRASGNQTTTGAPTAPPTQRARNDDDVF